MEAKLIAQSIYAQWALIGPQASKFALELLEVERPDIYEEVSAIVRNAVLDCLTADNRFS